MPDDWLDLTRAQFWALCHGDEGGYIDSPSPEQVESLVQQRQEREDRIIELIEGGWLGGKR